MALLCALAMRMIVPQGYMWSASAGGAPEMVFCPGDSTPAQITPLAAKALAAQHRSDQRDHDGKMADHPCAFAAASLSVDLVAAVHPVPAATRSNDAPVALPFLARPGLGLAAPPPPKTGPPAFA